MCNFVSGISSKGSVPSGLFSPPSPAIPVFRPLSWPVFSNSRTRRIRFRSAAPCPSLQLHTDCAVPRAPAGYLVSGSSPGGWLLLCLMLGGRRGEAVLTSAGCFDFGVKGSGGEGGDERLSKERRRWRGEGVVSCLVRKAIVCIAWLRGDSQWRCWFFRLCTSCLRSHSKIVNKRRKGEPCSYSKFSILKLLSMITTSKNGIHHVVRREIFRGSQADI